MIIPINKYGNIEIEGNLLKYRMPISEMNTTEIDEIEKNLKRKLMEIENLPFYLIPTQIESINTSVVFYYQLEHYKSFDYLRQLRFNEKLKYYLSLIEIGKKEEITKVIWDRFNFVVDPLEERIKTVVFETKNIKVYENREALEGVKELIIISLTKLDKYYGKPSKTDFLDQDDGIIEFVETILKINNLSDLDDYINTLLIELEHGDNNPDLVVEEKQEIKKRIIPFKNIPSQIDKSNKSKKQNSSNKDNKRIKILSGVLGVVVLVAVLLPVLFPAKDDSAKTKHKNKTIEVTSSVAKITSSKYDGKSKYDKQILTAYRLSMLGDNKKASQILENIGYGNLSKSDQEIMLSILEKNGELEKVFDLAPSKVKNIVNEMLAKQEEHKLISIQKKMKTSNPYVDFEVAYQKQDWKKVIALKDKVQLNGTRESEIVDAYCGLDKYKEAEKFAEKTGDPDLLDTVKSMEQN